MKSKKRKALRSALVGLSAIPSLALAQSPQPEVYNENEHQDNFTQESYIARYATNRDGSTLKFFIPKSEYFKLTERNHNPPQTSQYLSFVECNHRTIKDIARHLTRGLSSPEEKTQSILDYVHTFVNLPESPNYVKSPIETIVEGNGDCEDFTILGASLLESIGVDAALLDFGTLDHMALGVRGMHGRYWKSKEGIPYTYAECNGGTEFPSNPSQWRLGEVPDRFYNAPATVYPIE